MPLLLKVARKVSIRHYSAQAKHIITEAIYFSKCTDIYTNLALEDWLYKNVDFTNRHLLMLWRNEPCVVIGRHQNPWLECNFAALPSIGHGVKLARRNSGGGTVYHDMDNLNLTFFTSRGEYSRKRNLELISRALNCFGIYSEINEREDLCIDDRKISGTASKLGAHNAYHHCTLLVNANKENLSLALKNTLQNVKTNATRSVKSRIMNLSEKMPNITVDEVMRTVVMEYNKNVILLDEDFDMNDDDNDVSLSGVKTIDSINDEAFPGVIDIKNMFLSNEWRYEKTPKFTILRQLFSNITKEHVTSVSAFLTVEKGKVFNAGLENDNVILSVRDNSLRDLSALFNRLIELPFNEQVLDEFDMVVTGLKNSELCRSIIVNR